MAGTHLDEQALAVREDGSGVVKDAGFGPVLVALVMVDAAFETNGRSAGNRASVVHLHVAGHADDVAGADGLAHGFVEQGGDNAAVHIAAWAFEGVGDRRQADDRTVFGEHEFEMEADRVCGSATEAAIVRGVRKRGEFLGVYVHRVCAANVLSKAPERTLSKRSMSTLAPVITNPIRLFLIGC